MKPSAKPCRAQLTRAAWITVDLFIFLIAAGILVYVEFFAQNVKRGFFCGDKSISFSHRKDTVRMSTIILYGLTPFLIIWIVEFIFFERDEEEVESSTFGHRFRKSFRYMLKWFKYYGINLMFMLIIVEVTKVFVGELRPHFLETCKPDAAVNCSIGEFISDYECTNKEVSAYSLRDVQRSFPSGHSAIATFTSIYMIWYFSARIPKIQSIFLIPFLKVLLAVWTSFCSVSRVTDKRHSWEDIIGGVILGAICSIYACHTSQMCLYRNRNKIKPKISNVNGSSSNDSRRSVRRLLSTISSKEEFTLNNLE